MIDKDVYKRLSVDRISIQDAIVRRLRKNLNEDRTALKWYRLAFYFVVFCFLLVNLVRL